MMEAVVPCPMPHARSRRPIRARRNRKKQDKNQRLICGGEKAPGMGGSTARRRNAGCQRADEHPIRWTFPSSVQPVAFHVAGTKCHYFQLLPEISVHGAVWHAGCTILV